MDFRAVRDGFGSMRRHTMTEYKKKFGAWPPKAKSKKNDFEESGLNRILLQQVYKDFSDLYDLLVDRQSLTPRGAETAFHDEKFSEDLRTHTLRRLLNEFDRSTPPVQPPIPYDIPLLQTSVRLAVSFAGLPLKAQAKERMKKLKDGEINLALMNAYNHDIGAPSPFIEAFTNYERIAARSKTMDEVANLRPRPMDLRLRRASVSSTRRRRCSGPALHRWS